MSGDIVAPIVIGIASASFVADGAFRAWRRYTERLESADDTLDFLGTLPPEERTR